MPVNGKSNGRFELPQLTPVTFSLTDGTDIPPPPDSPIEEQPPAIPAAKPETAENSANGQTATAMNGNGVYEGRGRTGSTVQTNVSAPLSPTSPTRPGSIRRFLSRKSLNTNYTNGTNTNTSHEDLTRIDRPESSMSFASNGSVSKKKSGSWFRRIGSSGGGKRTSIIYEEKKVPVKAGPPPPKLPELSKLKAKIPEDDEGSLGGADMFKNIK